MDISTRGLDFIKEWEDLRLNAYYDQAGIPTIGYGTIVYPNGQRVQMGESCTPAQADEWLRWECRGIERALDALCEVVQLSQNQFDSLASFCYNVGVGGFGSSTLRRKLVAGEPIIEDYFVRWNKVHDPRTGKLMVSNGLTRRRKAEFAIFAEV